MTLAYSLQHTLPAQIMGDNGDAVNAKIAEDHGASFGRTVINQWSDATKNQYTTYEEIVIRDAPDMWSVRDQANDVHAYVPHNGAERYQITHAWRDMTYEEAKAKAKQDLGTYYLAYKSSQFVGGAKTYSADQARSVDYLTIAGFIEEDPTNIDYWITDITGDLTRIQTQQNWSNFYRAWRSLFRDAQTHMTTAWQAIRAGTTRQDVIDAMDALPPIPGTV